MLVLSVMQPWATALVLGIKRLETRTWRTAHRGTLAIQAARRRMGDPVPHDLRERLVTAQRRLGGEAWPDLFPRGAILGVVDLLDCVKVEDLAPDEPDPVERQLGDYTPNRWVWRLARPRPLLLPLLVRGQQGVFQVSLPEPLPGLIEMKEVADALLA